MDSSAVRLVLDGNSFARGVIRQVIGPRPVPIRLIVTDLLHHPGIEPLVLSARHSRGLITLAPITTDILSAIHRLKSGEGLETLGTAHALLESQALDWPILTGDAVEASWYRQAGSEARLIPI
jgi:hypothetical protein